MSTGPIDRGQPRDADTAKNAIPQNTDLRRDGEQRTHSRHDADLPHNGRRDPAPRNTAPRDPAPRNTAPRDPAPRDAAPRSATQGNTAPRSADPRDSRTSASTSAPVVDEVSSGGMHIGLWIALILGAIVLVLLLIFVIQNNVTTQFQYFGAQFQLPLGVAMLLAAVAGALVMALVGSVRMIQMGLSIRKLRKNQEKIRRATR